MASPKKKTDNKIARRDQAVDRARALLKAQEGTIKDSMPAGSVLRPGRLAAVAVLAVSQTPNLVAAVMASPAQFVTCVMRAAAYGLDPSGLTGEAYMVPFQRKAAGGGKVPGVQLLVGAQGYLAIARRSGEIKTITAGVVKEGDTFECNQATGETKHLPDLSKGRRTREIVAVYAYAELKSGGKVAVPLSVDEVDHFKSFSKVGSSGPWKDHWESMAKKTALRQLFKLLPRSTDMAALDTQDSRADVGIDQIEVDDAHEEDLGNVIEGDFTEKEPSPPTADPAKEMAAKKAAAIRAAKNETKKPDEKNKDAPNKTETKPAVEKGPQRGPEPEQKTKPKPEPKKAQKTEPLF